MVEPGYNDGREGMEEVRGGGGQTVLKTVPFVSEIIDNVE